MVSPLVFLLQVRLCKRMVSVMAIPIKPKDSVIPFLSSPPLPRPVLVSKDVFLKSSLASAAPRDPPPPSGPLPVWKCPVCGYENFSKFGKLPLFTTTGMLTEIPKHLYAPGKATPVPEATDLIPTDQRAWSCAICHKGPFPSPW